MVRRAKGYYRMLREEPGESWDLLKLLVGTLIACMFGALVYGCVGLFEKITGKDYLHRVKSNIPAKEKRRRK